MKTCILKNEYQEIHLLCLGASIYEWIGYKDKVNIVLNNKNFRDYLNPKTGYFGATIGRVAGRIKNARITLDNDKTYVLSRNNRLNSIHGGFAGFNLKMFDIVEQDDNKIVFKHVSKHLEEGYPGKLEVFVTYELTKNVLKVSYKATTNRQTIVNLTNHSYFNLGNKTILDHKLKANFRGYLELDRTLIPTGNIIPTNDTVFDFSMTKKIKDVVNSPIVKQTNGLDHMFLFSEGENEVELVYKNRKLIITTSYPGVQIYSLNKQLNQENKYGHKIPMHAGITFECQFEPDAINHPNFSNIILNPNMEYNQYITYELVDTT